MMLTNLAQCCRARSVDSSMGPAICKRVIGENERRTTAVDLILGSGDNECIDSTALENLALRVSECSHAGLIIITAENELNLHEQCVGLMLQLRFDLTLDSVPAFLLWPVKTLI